MESHWSGRKCTPAITVPPVPQVSLASPGAFPSPPQCPGSEFIWGLDDILASYPLSIHTRKSRRDPGYSLLSIDVVKSTLRVRSPKCCQFPAAVGKGCTSCTALEPCIEAVRNWALQPFGKKPSTRLSFDQLDQKLVAVQKQLKNEQLKKADHFKSLKRARKRVKSHQEFFDLISTNIIPGLYRLLAHAKTAGWSIEKTIEMALKALRGEHHPRNYTDFEKDLAILIYELGGGAALYALNKAPIMLPSRHAIADIRRSHSLRITVGDVEILEIMENIEMLFRNTPVGEQGRVLITLSQDEVAGDGRLCYLPDTDEIGGLCEHAMAELESLKMGSDLTSVKAAAKAIREDRVHVGKEFSVAAFARQAESDYGAKPALLMPTCKKSGWKFGAKNLQKLLQAWKLSPYGAAMHGDVKSIASDGDGGRRAAMYLICMHHKLNKDDDPELWELLRDLVGLNLFTGDDGLTQLYDPKHMDKRWCKLLCSKEGILINDVVINKTLITGWLERMTGHDWSDESIHALLNPKDPQDVPRAIKLLCLVAELRMAIDSTEFTPAELKTYRALCLLGEIFDAMLEPFINPTLSLSEQLISLVKFAHLICAMYIKHESAFISPQLYGDLQCMVKNVIFTIAHSKILNPYLKVFLCLLGDNVLETLFGRTRMIGGHSPNSAIDEFRQRVGSAMRMDEIFRKYPWLERRARRLNMVRSRDVDHLTPDVFEGDLTGASCDILACHKAGIAAAKAILETHGCDIDFDAQFAPEDCDLMRPKGGKYPGVSKEVDRSMPDDSGPVEDGDSSQPSDVAEILKFVAETALRTEKAARDADVAARPEGHSIWIKIDDDERKTVHKKSILRTVMDPTFDIDSAKSHDRLLRIRCFSVGGDHFDRAAAKLHSNINDEHLLKLHGLFATLVAFDTSRVALAVLQCTLIKITNKHPTYLDSAPVAEIALAGTQYEVAGQVLSLVPFTSSPDVLDWAWTTNFIEFDSVKAKQAAADSVARMRHLTVAVNGRLVLPLAPTDLRQASVEEILNVTVSDSATPPEKTWVFSNTQMEKMRSTLLEHAQEEEVRLKIPVYGPIRKGRYPYEATISDGDTQNDISYCLPSVQAPSPKDSHRKCRICSKNVAAQDRQNHVGTHILRSMSGVQEDELVSPVASNYPCGFCGQSMINGGCTIGIRSGNKASSTCSEAYEFAIKSALTSSAAHPCTNAPIRCILCQDVQWKYNMEEHLRDRHPKWELTKSRSDREAFAAMFCIPELECRSLGAAVRVSPPSPGQSEHSDAPVATAVGDSRGQKRPSVSPAGTPRISRVLKISPPGADGRRVVTIGFKIPSSISEPHTTSGPDVFT
ncbi:hypothetical protein B0H16DRAFT_1561498 [Mycena metata]|uniref:Uncharacterized protein n=1 Tax=Mycena metata TaxID=1033252 RepID=A0AAD7N306_9AGAR|nr:hypothetical protein B0H16DRAFT_1561498 [Mycena metata]